MNTYQIVCQHSRSATGSVHTETNLRRAKIFARAYVEACANDGAQAVVSKVAGKGARFPGALLRTEARYINRDGRTISVPV